jgi:threonine/homoserine/homoserine lactone efflux protein
LEELRHVCYRDLPLHHIRADNSCAYFGARPIVTLTIANSLAFGTRHGLKNVFGTSTATGLMLIFGGLGLASVFSLLAEWLEYLRWGGEGATYLIWLLIQKWLNKAADLNGAKIHVEPKTSLFRQGFLVSITNPKKKFTLLSFHKS